MTLKNVFRIIQRNVSPGGDAVGVFVSTAAGLLVLSFLAWLYVPEFKQVKLLAEHGVVGDGTVTSCKVKVAATFNRSAVYELQFDGPTGRHQFDTGIRRKVGDNIHYVESRANHLMRELSPGTSQEQVFADLTFTRANVIATLLAMIAFGYACWGVSFGIRAIVSPRSYTIPRIQFRYGDDVAIMFAVFILATGLCFRAAFHYLVLEAGIRGYGLVLLFGGPLASGVMCFLAWLGLCRRRSNNLCHVAESLGLTFQRVASGKDQRSMELPRMRRQIGGLRNVLRGEYGGVDIAIFDVRLGCRIGRSSVQTVVGFPEEIVSLPDFSSEVWFENTPPQIQEAVSSRELCAAESHAGKLTLYRPARLVCPKGYPVLLDLAIETRSVICQLCHTA